MKAISLWQPHANLIAVGAKLYETRTWSDPYRGKIAIHAGKNRDELNGMSERIRWLKEGNLWTEEAQAGTFLWEMVKAIKAWRITHNKDDYYDDEHTFGVVVAIGDLTAIYRGPELYPHLKSPVNLFGEFGRGYYAWEIQNVEALKVPYKLRGQQKLWDLPQNVVDDLMSAEKWSQS